ncbi:hypothetical protein [Frankia tisae]|uniref:hypothetical protein n=1 Tax=Frankia tisae TaxID=2950104 RepID=UPI0021C0A873|nr:hypothetical protein [Frankia tisae]
MITVITVIPVSPAPHAGRVYPLFGPKELNHYEIAEEMTQALGRPVTYRLVSLDEFTKELQNRGFGEYTGQHLRPVASDYVNGVFAGTNDVVKTAGGKEPQTVRECVTRNRKYYEDRSTSDFWSSAADRPRSTRVLRAQV